MIDKKVMLPVPDEVRWLVHCYGFLVPDGQTWTGMKFASAIAEAYDCFRSQNPGLTARVIAMEQIFSIARRDYVYSVKYIVKGEVS